MNIAQALELAGKSLDAFEKKCDDMKLKELLELTDNLRFANNPRVFNTAYTVLKNKLVRFYERAKRWENEHKKEDFKKIKLSFGSERFHAFKITGFDIFNPFSPEVNLDILPSEFYKSCIDKISGWQK